MLKRALSPIQSLIIALRMHDTDRVNAARSTYFNPHRLHRNHRNDATAPTTAASLGVPSSGGSYFAGNLPPSPGAPEAASLGYMSPVRRFARANLTSQLAKTYLSDVLDHMDAVLSSLELFSGLASNLVDFSCVEAPPRC